MSKQIVVRLSTIIMCLGLMLSAGCAHLLQPEMGAVARKEARIALTGGAIPAGTLTTGDLRLTYSLAHNNDVATISGKLVFDRNIRDSFQTITKFFLYLSYLDEAGKVLESVDISPVIPTYGAIPDSLQFTLSRVPPPGSKAFAFHYSGEFRSDQRDSGAGWNISYFPFNR